MFHLTSIVNCNPGYLNFPHIAASCHFIAAYPTLGFCRDILRFLVLIFILLGRTQSKTDLVQVEDPVRRIH